MIDFIVGGVIVICVILSIAYSRKMKKTGQSSCGSNCAGCSMTSCSDKQQIKPLD